MMSTELDLSFGKTVGFAVAAKQEKTRSVPANVALRDSRARLIELITFLKLGQVGQGKHMLIMRRRDATLTLPSFSTKSNKITVIKPLRVCRVRAAILCRGTCSGRRCSTTRAYRGRLSGSSPRRC